MLNHFAVNFLYHPLALDAMGVAITDLLVSKQVAIEDLNGKVLAVDAYNILYQFLSSIRNQDGTPLMDSKGRVTSHLMGLFMRFSRLLEYNIKLIFVFDGKVPDLKKKEQERRHGLKVEAQKQYDVAKEAEDTESMRKFASRTSRLTTEMVHEAQELLSAMGIPWLQAPSEGEAQAAFMVKQGDAYAIVSQDADCFLFGASRFIKNLTLSEKRKKVGKLAFEKVVPEILSLSDNLNHLGVVQDQLIVLSMLVGTDYNPGGIKGIGPKNALKMVKQYKMDFEALFKEAKWDDFFSFSWKEVFDTFKNIPTSKEYKLEWRPVNEEAVLKVLVEEHGFSRERVKSSLDKLSKSPAKQQKGLSDFFGGS